MHSAGYLSCMSSVAAFGLKGDMIFADKNIHSCLLDGIRLSLAGYERFQHNSPEDLEDRNGLSTFERVAFTSVICV